MKHAHVTEYYTAYLDGDLPETLRQEVDAHVRVCPQCAAELRELRALVADMRTLPILTPPADFTAGVRTRLQQHPRRHAWRWPVPALGGGTLAVAAALLIMLQFSPSTPISNKKASPPRQVAQAPLTQVVIPDAGTTNPVLPYVRAEKHRQTQAHRVTVATNQQPPMPAAPKPASTVSRPVMAAPSIPSTGEESARIVVALAPPEVMDKSIGALERADVLGHSVTSANTVKDAPGAPLVGGSTVPRGTAVPETGLPSNDDGYLDTTSSAGALTFSVTPPSINTPEIIRFQTPVASEVLPVNDGRWYAATSWAKLANGGMLDSMTTGVNTQILRTGNFQAEVQANTDRSREQQVLLRVNTTRARSTMLINYADERATGKKYQNVTLPAKLNDVVMNVPRTQNGAALQLTMKENGDAEAFYLVVPGDGPRQEKTSVHSNNQSYVETLQHLSNASGVYVLCPADFAERKMSAFDADNIPPIEAILQLAEQANFSVGYSNQLLNIIPSR